MKTKFFLLLVSGVLAGSTLFAQSLTPVVISSSGGYVSSAAGSLSSTVAEMTMVQTFSSMGNFLTQGFQQPEEWYTSVNEEQQTDEGISIYPNPSNGKFSVTVNSKETGLAEVHLYDILGQKTFTIQMEIGTGLNTENIDIRDYAMGMYFLEYLYTGDNGKKESKVVKINLVY
ncbi:MAG TPA: T9SS type A sorting domain-containing protein [Bacteroidales bacterium]|nr:T9SS type A sorting domain-containing protein [Bacteroidales bacterium]